MAARQRVSLNINGADRPIDYRVLSVMFTGIISGRICRPSRSDMKSVGAHALQKISEKRKTMWRIMNDISGEGIMAPRHRGYRHEKRKRAAKSDNDSASGINRRVGEDNALRWTISKS